MTPSNATRSPLIRLADYRPPPWRVEWIELDFDLGIERADIHARMGLCRDPAQNLPLHLNGEALELQEIRLDGRTLTHGDWRLRDGILEVDGAGNDSVLETLVRVYPSKNTALEGLYLSGLPEQGFLLTQCEAEGFRRITFFPDRPDVLARYTVTLRADRERFPILLAGGNPDGNGTLTDGRHWARFIDPHPKPSYLFALVAGRLEKIERDYHAADGRYVKLAVWSEASTIAACGYAMDALERAMRWDERSYGRTYDLDAFHVVATHDFNMGAMENKGLNIFNAKYLLANRDTTTDDEFRGVESVIAHEYFHNWSGNRVTCRDWFQLSLKEGLTVFREQQFSSEQYSPSLKRIEDVSLLRRTQFPEDAGPLAHPVRPDEYREINNFYTATVYEKGAELISMLAGALGPTGFRRGMDCYFQRNDGRAATIEDFLSALGDANGMDLTRYLSWYGQAGTPRLRARGRYDEARHEYVLTLSQHTPATPQQPEKAPLPIPVKLALFGASGQLLDLRIAGRQLSRETVVVLDQPEDIYTFEQIPEPPVPSLLRNFSAPVILEYDYTPAELALLLAHDPDGFNRWEAGQQLARRAFGELCSGAEGAATAAWCETLGRLFDQRPLDDALLADLLTPPGEVELAQNLSEVDPDACHAIREQLQRRLATHLDPTCLIARYHAITPGDASIQEAHARAQRRLRRRILELLILADPGRAQILGSRQYADADNMTDRLGALAILVRHEAPQTTEMLEDFRRRFADSPLVMDKWFSVQARIPGKNALSRVRVLESDAAFTLKNPNRVRALLGAYAHSNPSGFHRIDGEGYRLLGDRLVQIDLLNPQVAARLATSFNDWRRLEPTRRQLAKDCLEELARQTGLSKNLSEIVGRILGG